MTHDSYRKRLAALRARRDVAHWLFFFENSERAALELWRAEAVYQRRAAVLAERFNRLSL